MEKIRRIEPNIPRLAGRKRVAAYARVSMETELLHHSLSAQVSHYSSLIQSNPEWEYVGVYADEGIFKAKGYAEVQWSWTVFFHNKVWRMWFLVRSQGLAFQ